MNSMRAGLVGKLASVLESVLSKLGRYDEGSVIGSILSFTVRKQMSVFPSPSQLGLSFAIRTSTT